MHPHFPVRGAGESERAWAAVRLAGPSNRELPGGKGSGTGGRARPRDPAAPTRSNPRLGRGRAVVRRRPGRPAQASGPCQPGVPVNGARRVRHEFGAARLAAGPPGRRDTRSGRAPPLPGGYPRPAGRARDPGCYPSQPPGAGRGPPPPPRGFQVTGGRNRDSWPPHLRGGRGRRPSRPRAWLRCYPRTAVQGAAASQVAARRQGHARTPGRETSRPSRLHAGGRRRATDVRPGRRSRFVFAGRGTREAARGHHAAISDTSFGLKNKITVHVSPRRGRRRTAR